ncbi:non-hydrolyzing UDP-N-acetylglucosamine 2-epimerase [Pseudomonas sp. GCM10022186]|uniref:non-hydrolyzing UDP-N-acetylglucosamine 2-epimerase n=1 Tax=Pseudomonas sp. GCM10022186 TaxID=3252650 RepID=UPI00361FC43C
MKVLTIVGARPQFIKAATVSRVIRKSAICSEVMVHTGQHFDANMSDVFFQELDIPEPTYNLGVGGGTHGQNTGRMLEAIEGVMLKERPDVTLVYGDTDSTLAGALAAAKIHIPVVHVEAGLRSFNKRMPEEINRQLTDHISALLLTPNDVAVENLAKEGIQGPQVRNVGDVMYDAALFFGEKAEHTSKILERLDLASKGYILATVHRQENTDDAKRLGTILEGFARMAHPVVLPLHPRTKQRIASFGLQVPANVRILEPLGYIDMVMLEKHAFLVATDSGGVQKEAYFHGVPCLTLRDETEWVELVQLGWNTLLPPGDVDFLDKVSALPGPGTPGASPYGSGRAADLVIDAIVDAFR